MFAARILTVALLAAFSATAWAGVPDHYQYNSVGKRDPFRSEYRRKVIRRPGPLEQFDLSQLKVVAVISSIARPMALVETPDGTQYVVVPKTPLGRNQGRVVRIVRSGIVVAERAYDWKKRKYVRHYSRLEIIKEPGAFTPERKDASHPWATLWPSGESKQ